MSIIRYVFLKVTEYHFLRFRSLLFHLSVVRLELLRVVRFKFWKFYKVWGQIQSVAPLMSVFPNSWKPSRVAMKNDFWQSLGNYFHTMDHERYQWKTSHASHKALLRMLWEIKRLYNYAIEPSWYNNAKCWRCNEMYSYAYIFGHLIFLTPNNFTKDVIFKVIFPQTDFRFWAQYHRRRSLKRMRLYSSLIILKDESVAFSPAAHSEYITREQDHKKTNVKLPFFIAFYRSLMSFLFSWLLLDSCRYSTKHQISSEK